MTCACQNVFFSDFTEEALKINILNGKKNRAMVFLFNYCNVFFILTISLDSLIHERYRY